MYVFEILLTTLPLALVLIGLLLLFHKWLDKVLPAKSEAAQNQQQQKKKEYLYGNGKAYKYDEVRKTNNETSLMLTGIVMAIIIVLARAEIF